MIQIYIDKDTGNTELAGRISNIDWTFILLWLYRNALKRCIVLCTILIFNYSLAQRTNDFEKVDSIVKSFEQSTAPGFSIGIVENGKLIYSRGIGLANIETGVKNSESSVFGIASLAKQLTAACIWSLIKESKLSLDDDIRKYIPEFPFYGETIRIRHMLNHTSGIRNYHAIMELAGFDYDREFHDNQTILDLACKQKGLNNRPGEKVIYGNTSYTLLAIIIERITDQNLDQYAKDKIFQPLGMHHTFYRIETTTVIPNRSLGYFQNDDENYTHVSSNQITYGAGSVGSSIEDLSIWSNILNGINPDYLELTQFLSTVETLQSGEIAKYARGVMVDDYKNKKTIHHSGYSLGGQSQIIVVPELKLAIIILTNLESIDPLPLSYKILDIFLPAEPVKLSDLSYYKKQKLNCFVGQYKEQNSDMKMEILLENDTLKALGSQGRNSIPLLSTEKGKFTRLNNPNILYDFVSGKNTTSDLIIYFGGTPFYFSKAKFIDPKSVNLNDYVGHYFSEELSVGYDVYIENNSLFVHYPNHSKTKLIVGQKDEFGNGQRTLYRFERNKENKMTKLYLSSQGTVKNIEFNKK